LIETAALISGAVFLILHIIFLIGYLRSSKLEQISGRILPSVSIIVAARNEEKVIRSCIESLKKIKYTGSELEIILVNDQSTDLTRELMLKETSSDTRFKVIDTGTSSESGLKGKPRAIDIAIRQAKGELILMTDADCTVHENWAEETVKYYTQKTGMVCGFTKIAYEHSLFAKVQAIDWIYLQAIATCSSGINLHTSCIGNNLSVRKDTYLLLGGYNKIKFSVTEDLALMRRIHKGKLFDVKYPVNPFCLVTTQECKNLKELYNQKKRWFRGGIGINFLGYILGTELYIVNLIFLTGFLYLSPAIYLISVLLKIIAELLIIIPVCIKFRYSRLMEYYILFEIYFALYGLLLPFTFLTGKNINWKGRKH